MQGAGPRLAATMGLAVVGAALVVGACSKGEPENKPAAPAAPVAAAPKAGDVTLDPAAEAALKERLARQEAASKMFERNVLQPTPPKAAEPKPAPEAPKVAEPPPAPKEAPREAPKPVVAAAPVEAPKPATAPPASPSPAPAKAAPRTDVAAAKPSAAPESTAPRLLSRVEPSFPAEAARGGIDSGRVIARMTLDASGRVTDVEIVEAQPRRIFDRSVRVALGQWRFNEGAPGRTVESEIDFRR